MTAHLSDGRQLKAPLLIAAEGRNSPLRKSAGSGLSQINDFNFVNQPGGGVETLAGTLQFNGGNNSLGGTFNGFTTVALCFPNDGTVITVLANTQHDVDTVAGDLVQAANR